MSTEYFENHFGASYTMIDYSKKRLIDVNLFEESQSIEVRTCIPLEALTYKKDLVTLDKGKQITELEFKTAYDKAKKTLNNLI